MAAGPHDLAAANAAYNQAQDDFDETPAGMRSLMRSASLVGDTGRDAERFRGIAAAAARRHENRLAAWREVHGPGAPGDTRTGLLRFARRCPGPAGPPA